MGAILLLIALIGTNAVCAEKRDVAFVLDGSETVCGGPETPEGCPNWKSILHFVEDLIDHWEIGPNETQVALATFGDEAKVEWYLNTYANEDELDSAIDSVPYPGGELTQRGIVKKMVNEIFNEDNGNRSDARDVDLMVTDGAPYSDPQGSAARSKVLQSEGITMIVVCIRPGCNETFAERFASPTTEEITQTTFYVDGFDSFDDIKEELLEQISAIKNDN